MPRFTYGGQALIEGVMMRGRDAVAVALRHPDGRIVYATEQLESGFRGKPAAKWPFVRGLVVLYETLVMGTKWLVRSPMNGLRQVVANRYCCLRPTHYFGRI